MQDKQGEDVGLPGGGGCQIFHQDLGRRRGVRMNGAKSRRHCLRVAAPFFPCAQLCQPSMEPALNPCLKTLDSKLHDGFATQVTTVCFCFGRFSPTT